MPRQAHRDKSHAAVHAPDGAVQMVTTWVPFVPVEEGSGCMYVVPAERDPLFAATEDPRHLRVPEEARKLGEPVPCGAGDVVVWRSSLVHWGSACTAPRAAPPRKSMSRRAGKGRPSAAAS